MNTSLLVIFALTLWIALSQGFGLDCETSQHSCETCVNSNCYWCHTESSADSSFCTSNPNTCVRGSLFEDSLFCPITKSSMESLEWWGENSFFSRQTSCSELTNSCQQCLSFSDLNCGWCSGGTNACAPISATTQCSLLIGCVLSSTPSSTTDEDVSVSLAVNTLFFISTQTNGTVSSLTSNSWTVTTVSSSSNCVVTWEPTTDTLTMTPALDWSGTCLIQITAKSTPTIGYTTSLKANWTITVNPADDPIQRIEQNFDTTLSGLANAQEGQIVSIEGCRLFSDPDKVDFTVTITGQLVDDGSITPTNEPCTCYTGTKKCPIGYTANSGGSGDITITASDGSSTADGSVGVTIAIVNESPTASSGLRTLTANEGDESLTFDFAVDFTDPDNYPNTPLEYSITSLSPLALETSFEGAVLTIRPDPTKNGTVSANVTATDGEKTAVKMITFVLNPTNDPVVVADSLNGKVFSNAAGQNTTYDLSSEVTDEDNVFSDNSLTCTAPPVDGGVAVVTITRGILLIQHRIETSGTTVTITCQDNRSPSLSAFFDINIVVTFTNSAPTSSAMPLVTSVPPAAGQITLNPISLSTFFTDRDLAIGQTLSYTAVASNSSAVDFSSSSLDGGVLSIIMKAGAIGTYSINVTATDNYSPSLSVTQTQSVLAYVAPTCSSINATWNPISSLVVNVASSCVASNALSIAFTETELGSIYNNVSFSISGNQITFTSSDSCVSGKYMGVVTVTDTTGKSVNVSVELTAKPSEATVSSIKSSFSYLVIDSPSTNSTGYDGIATVNATKVAINLLNFVKLCASNGNITFDKNGTDVFTFLAGQNNNDGLKSEVDGVNLLIDGSTRPGTIVRRWSLQAGIIATDTQSGSTASFTLTVTKPYSG